MTKTALYRHFDAKGKLIYIGIATDPWRRMIQHQSTQPWAGDVASMQVAWLDSRDDALAAERAAILKERPIHNIAMNSSDAMVRFVNIVGHQVIADAVGLCLSAVHNAVVRRQFPASWAFVIACLAHETGQFCPKCAFPWKGENPDDGKCITDLFDLDYVRKYSGKEIPA